MTPLINEFILFLLAIVNIVDGLHPLGGNRFETHWIEKINKYLQGVDSVEHSNEIFGNNNRYKRKSVGRLDLNDGWKKIAESDDVDAYVFFKNNLQSLDANNKIRTPKGPYKKILIKRLVPHGQALTNGMEYDRQFNTYYRPLVKFHGLKHKYTPNKKHVPLYIEKGDFNILPYHEDTSNYHTNYFKVHQGHVNVKHILDDIKSYVAKADRKKVMKLKNAILAIIEKQYLREMLFLSSGEPHSSMEEAAELTWPQNIKDLPEYPFWDYWTYQKTVHQDGCKGNLVKIGNVCVETPHH